MADPWCAYGEGSDTYVEGTGESVTQHHGYDHFDIYLTTNPEILLGYQKWYRWTYTGKTHTFDDGANALYASYWPDFTPPYGYTVGHVTMNITGTLVVSAARLFDGADAFGNSPGIPDGGHLSTNYPNQFNWQRYVYLRMMGLVPLFAQIDIGVAPGWGPPGEYRIPFSYTIGFPAFVDYDGSYAHWATNLEIEITGAPTGLHHELVSNFLYTSGSFQPPATCNIYRYITTVIAGSDAELMVDGGGSIGQQYWTYYGQWDCYGVPPPCSDYHAFKTEDIILDVDNMHIQYIMHLCPILVPIPGPTPTPAPNPVPMSSYRRFQAREYRGIVAVAWCPTPPDKAKVKPVFISVNESVRGNVGTGTGNTGGWNTYYLKDIDYRSDLGLSFLQNGNLVLDYDEYSGDTKTAKYIVSQRFGLPSARTWSDPFTLTPNYAQTLSAGLAQQQTFRTRLG